jgi:hypothetical protein
MESQSELDPELKSMIGAKSSNHLEQVISRANVY